MGENGAAKSETATGVLMRNGKWQENWKPEGSCGFIDSHQTCCQ